MMVTDTLDGRIICRIGRGIKNPEAGRRVRRTLGWLIVAISFGVAVYNVAKVLLPEVELDDMAFSFAGAALVVVMLGIWAWSARRARGAKAAAMPGLREDAPPTPLPSRTS